MGDKKTELQRQQKPEMLLYRWLVDLWADVGWSESSRRHVGICRPVGRVGLYEGAVQAVWPQTCQLHPTPATATMSPASAA